MCVYVCQAKVELESRRGKASLESLLAEGEKSRGSGAARREGRGKSRRERGVGREREVWTGTVES